MKKYTRQRIILDLIEEFEIRTQEELSEYLMTRAFAQRRQPYPVT